MAQHSKQKDSQTYDIIEDLFVHPPINEAELKQRMEKADTTLARRLIIDRLGRNDLPDWGGPLFLAVLGNLGLGRQKRRLTKIALDLERNARERLWAAMALMSDDPKVMDYLVNELGPDGMGFLAELSLFELLTMQNPDEIGHSIATALEDLLDERPIDEFLSRIESCRRGIGASCATAYGEALRMENIEFLRPKILDLFVLEASDEGIDFLVNHRDQAQNDDARRDFQAALLRLRSRRIDPELEQAIAHGYGLVSNCDGQGNFVVLGVFENQDGTSSIADLSIRVDGDIRDGIIYPRRQTSEVDNLASNIQFSLGCSFIETSLAEAAGLVAQGVGRTIKQNQTVPEDARHAVALFERVDPEFKWSEEFCADSTDTVTLETVRELLAAPEYDDTWFFDQGDLISNDIRPKPSQKISADWIKQSCIKLDKPPLKSRLVAMTEHMARWHYWNNEPETAALLKAISRSTERHFEKSPLVRAMLERSMATIGDNEADLAYQFGDPGERQHFKLLFFQKVKKPTGLDMARLDMTEAAASALNTAFELLPGERRPREEERDAAAYATGKIFADQVTAGKIPRPEQAVSEMSRALAGACRLTESERHEVLMTVVPLLYAFVEEICAVCPIGCLSQPDRDMSEFFFTLDHPMNLVENNTIKKESHE